MVSMVWLAPQARLDPRARQVLMEQMELLEQPDWMELREFRAW